MSTSAVVTRPGDGTNPLKPPIRVCGISGSLRPGSYTRAAVRIALEGAAEWGAETRVLDLCHYDLVFCNGETEEQSYPPDVGQLRREVRACQAIILGTPEYHGSMSGVLKNSLDLMGFDEFEGKLLGLIGVAGSTTGAFDALNHLRSIGRALHAWVIPEQVSIARASQMFDESGRVLNRQIEKRLRAVGRQVARFAFLHHSARTIEVLKQWEHAPENPGGRRAW